MASADRERVHLRAVTAEDDPFLYKVYASTRADEMARVPWDEAQKAAFLRMQWEAQQLHYQTHNPNSTHDLILLDKDAVGRLYVSRRKTEIRILDITILLEYRNRGLGTPLIKELMREAAQARLPLNLYVESFNPSLHLFERLGFSIVESDGINQLMEWRAPSLTD
jgi:ribosomal protein S18 acetylase RimI-like enzyme